MEEVIYETRRPFHWGAVLVMDAETSDIPQHPDGDGVGRTSSCLSFPVRHAQDTAGGTAFEVAVMVRRGRSDTPSLEHTIHVPSGAVTVGDAEGEERIDIGVTTCDVAVDLEDPWHSENVTVWLDPRP